MESGSRIIIVQAGDRIDILADRVYGDPYKYTILIEANPNLDIWHPQPGQRIIVPYE